MTDKLPDEKSILTAARQVLDQYHGNARDARLHAARLSDEFRDKGDVEGHLLWEKIHRAIFELTDTERDDRALH